jgi:hypothetical protein
MITITQQQRFKINQWEARSTVLNYLHIARPYIARLTLPLRPTKEGEACCEMQIYRQYVGKLAWNFALIRC